MILLLDITFEILGLILFIEGLWISIQLKDENFILLWPQFLSGIGLGLMLVPLLFPF